MKDHYFAATNAVIDIFKTHKYMLKIKSERFLENILFTMISCLIASFHRLHINYKEEKSLNNGEIWWRSLNQVTITNEDDLTCAS